MKKTYISLSIASAILTGCAQHQVKSNQSSSDIYPLPVENLSTMNMDKTEPVFNEQVIVPDIYQYSDEQSTQIIRQGRYTLVNTSPEDGQKYLLEQMVTVNMLPKKKQTMTATVEKGLKTTLSGTGLSLCYGSGFNQTASLFSLPLPKVHHQFGPIKLREALQMLAGPAYYLTVNDITRTVCFKMRDKPIDVEKKRIEIISTTTKTEVVDE